MVAKMWMRRMCLVAQLELASSRDKMFVQLQSGRATLHILHIAIFK